MSSDNPHHLTPIIMLCLPSLPLGKSHKYFLPTRPLGRWRPHVTSAEEIVVRTPPPPTWRRDRAPPGPGSLRRHDPIAVRPRTSSTASSPHRRQPAHHPPWRRRLAAGSLPVRSRIPTEEDDENLGRAAVLAPSSFDPAPYTSASYPGRRRLSTGNICALQSHRNLASTCLAIHLSSFSALHFNCFRIVTWRCIIFSVLYYSSQLQITVMHSYMYGLPAILNRQHCISNRSCNRLAMRFSGFRDGYTFSRLSLLRKRGCLGNVDRGRLRCGRVYAINPCVHLLRAVVRYCHL
jgi:hypothetical protein